uniref:Uncharacterized protein n=1 Tax=Sinocyclocheilus rhinocerous TaxID=307959 RepID=A0A673HVQ2_9TELE
TKYFMPGLYFVFWFCLCATVVREGRSVGPSTEGYPVPLPGIAEEFTQLVEGRAAVCLGTDPKQEFFFFLSPLSRLSQSREYPPACEGRWGYVTRGAGPRAMGTERGRWSNC